MRKVNGQGEETWGLTWEEIRQKLTDAGMNRDSFLVEWSNLRIDHRLLQKIMKDDTPSNSVMLVNHWKAILPGFSSMRLGYFHSFIYPDSTVREYSHQAGFDSLMLVDGMKAMVDLVHRDETPE